jgi:hypothetical protein
VKEIKSLEFWSSYFVKSFENFMGYSQLDSILGSYSVFKLLRSPGIDSTESVALVYVTCAGNFKQSVGARNRLGIELSYRPARLHRLAD